MTPLTPKTRASRIWFCGIVMLLALGAGGSFGWLAAQHRYYDAVVEERNFASLIIVKVLTQFREGETEEALLVLETALDMNVSFVWEQMPASEKTTNILFWIKRYRIAYPSFSEAVRTSDNPVLKERHERANSILGVGSSN